MYTNKLTAAALGIMIAMGATAADASDDRTRMKCKDRSEDRLSSMTAVYKARERRRLREKFKASFETAFGLDHMEGDVLQVSVDGEVVGLITLALKDDGELGGKVKFDSKIDDDPNSTKMPFPANWPGIGPGSVVMVGTMGCSLQLR